ncbi:MAG: protein-glutamate O-methyltransferase CheR [Alicyclobacillus sp.]|nr:protein-glutamate O-methyltransferase CheR [Alicyclobacillus sp.]
MDDFLDFSQALLKLTGIDLRLYKRPQMERRLTALRNRHGFHDFRSYAQALAQQPQYLAELLDKMTINVSEFLRNPERWEALLERLEQPVGRPLRVWSAACATGEEPYTLALLFAERGWPHDTWATDIDARALALARTGRYKETQIRLLPTEYVARYFTHEADEYIVHDVLKRHVRFAQHNLLADPFPQSLDLIVCRNVLIYFTDAAKQQVLRGFAQALRPGGLLFVGSTEQFLGTDPYGLVPVGPFLYRRTAG